MKKRSRFVFLIATATAGCILVCQLYWIYFNYKIRKENFRETASYALKQSVDQYQLAQNKLPTSLKSETPTLTFFMRTLPDNDPLALDTPESKRRFSAEFATVAVDREHLSEVKALVGRLLSQQKHLPLDLDTLTKIFHKQLRLNNVTQRFRLYADRNRNMTETGQIATIVNFFKDPVLIRAEMVGGNHYLMTSNFIPALVSSFLVIMSAGSLYYMSIIIRRQMRLDRMRADFINNITHQLRTPLSILKSSNEALIKFGAADDPGSLDRYLKRNAAVIDTLDSDIERIMEFSRSEQGGQAPVFEKVMLRELVEQVVRRFEILGNSDIGVEIKPAFEITTDPYMLSTVLANLIDNAVKYSTGRARIEIAADRHLQNWRLTVRDEGIGIPATELPFIFDKFYRVPTGDLHEVKGYGIGLAHVRQLVNAMKGTVSVSSTLGQGTSFKLTFV